MASAATVAPIDPNRKKRKYNTGGAAAAAAAATAAAGASMGRDSDDEDFRGGSGVDGEAGEKERYVSRENHCETERRRRIKMAA